MNRKPDERSTTYLHGRRIVERGELRKVKNYVSPIDETLWAQLEQVQDTLDMLDAVYHPPLPDYPRVLVEDKGTALPEEADPDERTSGPPTPLTTACRDPEACVILRGCQEMLERARDCIDRRRTLWWPFLENVQLFWRLIHQIDADVLLLVPVPSLAARAVYVQEIVERKVIGSWARKLWLGTAGKAGALPAAVDAINTKPDEPPQDPAVADWKSPYRTLQKERQVLRQALQMANERSDRHFRQLAFNTLIRVASVPLLIAFAFLGAWLYHLSNGVAADLTRIRPQLMLAIVGAMGAMTSNMLTRSLLLATTGPTRRYLLYNLVMRPALGAVAAYFFVIVAQSALLFKINVSGVSARTTTAQVVAIDPAPPAPAEASSGIRDSLVTINLGNKGEELFAYLVFAFVFGFSADRVLSRTLDQALQRLFTTAEKTSVRAGRLEEQGAE